MAEIVVLCGENGNRASALIWVLKMGAKIVLLLLHRGRSLWRRLGLFRQRAMDSDAYAISALRYRHQRMSAAGFVAPFVRSELGPAIRHPRHYFPDALVHRARISSIRERMRVIMIDVQNHFVPCRRAIFLLMGLMSYSNSDDDSLAPYSIS